MGDYLNITCIPDDLLQTQNLSYETTSSQEKLINTKDLTTKEKKLLLICIQLAILLAKAKIELANQ